MATTTISLEELSQIAGEVGEASDNGPVYVTRPGKLPLVLLTVNEYRKLSGEKYFVDPPIRPEDCDVLFDRSRMSIEQYRKMTGHLPSLADMLAGREGVADIEFEPPRMDGIWHHDVELTD